MSRNSCIITVAMIVLPCISRGQAMTQPVDSILFTENFNDNAHGWNIVDHGDSLFSKIENGHYVMNAKGFSRYWALRFRPYTSVSVRPNVLQVKFKFDSDSSKAVAGITWNYVRYNDPLFEEFQFLISKNGYFGIFRIDKGRSYFVKNWTACSCINTSGYNVLTIIADTRMAFSNGTQIDYPYQFFINDKLVHNDAFFLTDLSVIGFYIDRYSILSVDNVNLYQRK